MLLVPGGGKRACGAGSASPKQQKVFMAQYALDNIMSACGNIIQFEDGLPKMCNEVLSKLQDRLKTENMISYALSELSAWHLERLQEIKFGGGNGTEDKMQQVAEILVCAAMAKINDAIDKLTLVKKAIVQMVHVAYVKEYSNNSTGNYENSKFQNDLKTALQEAKYKEKYAAKEAELRQQIEHEFRQAKVETTLAGMDLSSGDQMLQQPRQTAAAATPTGMDLSSGDQMLQ